VPIKNREDCKDFLFNEEDNYFQLDVMMNIHESPDNERIDRLSTEKGMDDDVHRGSKATFSSPEIVPTYKSDHDLERGIEERPDDTKLGDAASTESHQKTAAAQELGDDDDYPPGMVTRTWRRYRPFGHAIIWLLFTAYTSPILNF
jgi:hypothetical protein